LPGNEDESGPEDEEKAEDGYQDVALDKGPAWIKHCCMYALGCEGGYQVENKLTGI
jgi:hypothetical protein